MRVLPANAPISWGIMEEEGWSPTLEYTAFLDQLELAGYEGTELGPYGYMPPDAEELNGQLRRRSIELVSAVVPLRLKERKLDLDPVYAVGQLLSVLGADYIALSDFLWPERSAVAGRVNATAAHLTNREWRTVGDNMRAAYDIAMQFGLRCMFHHHAGTYIETPEEISRLLESTDVGLCLDTGHYVYGGGDPVDAVRLFRERVGYLHFKDVDAGKLNEVLAAKRSFLDGVRTGVFCEIGKGCVRFRDLLAELERIGYDGWAVVEQDIEPGSRTDKSPLDCARASREYMRAQFGI